ncbi:dihydropteroate synthase [Purpureocillium lavendulum]|uniref:Dihydropteroate synthase n=1 Tax=Purpureocillium lavendulum TaxID=1247861 RepID=A0AB34G434_9HYPO|nr:dihydropteroate synthase [Purpureocillium lavendulum]
MSARDGTTGKYRPRSTFRQSSATDRSGDNLTIHAVDLAAAVVLCLKARPESSRTSGDMSAVPPRNLWQLHVAVGEAPAVVRVRNLQATVKGPNDAWGRRGRLQPILVSCKVELRQPFSGTSSADALASDTVHYGQLSKAILASLDRLASETCSPEPPASAPATAAAQSAGASSSAAASSSTWPLSLCEVLTYIWIDLTGFYPNGRPVDADDEDGDGHAVPTPSAATTPFIRNLRSVRCIELTGHLPKASLVGDGPSFTFTGVFGNDLVGTSMRIYGRTLRLQNLRVPTLIGINDNEREARQAAIVSVEVDNYEAHFDIFNKLESKIVDRLENSSFGTLEALASDLAETITLYLRLEREEPMDGSGSQLKIIVEKPIAVPFADAPSVELRVNTRDVPVDNALVEAVGPVVEDDLEVVGVLEWQAPRNDGLLPPEALAENEGGDGSVCGGLAVGVGLVAAQLGRDALEALELVGCDERADLGPGEKGEGGVRGADDPAVLVAEIEEERRALGRPVGLGDVVVPVRNWIEGAHVGAWLVRRTVLGEAASDSDEERREWS